MALDCDSDALLFTVRQRGAPPAFCHLNTRTCWGEDGGLTALQVRAEAGRLAEASSQPRLTCMQFLAEPSFASRIFRMCVASPSAPLR